jgi:hypothetical protein
MALDKHHVVSGTDGAEPPRGAGEWARDVPLASTRGQIRPGRLRNEVLEVAAETSGTPVPFIRAALDYWSDYPEEVDDFLDRARVEAAQAQAAWERRQGLLGL